MELIPLVLIPLVYWLLCFSVCSVYTGFLIFIATLHPMPSSTSSTYNNTSRCHTAGGMTSIWR